MFDPTVFDNLKVVLEGAIYDLDLKGQVEIIDRSDLVDLAKMARSYSVTLAKDQVEGLVELTTDVESWSGEIMENGVHFPCQLFFQFFVKIKDIDHSCSGIRFRLSQIWRPYKPKIEQQISFMYGNNVNQPVFHDQINIFFNNPIDESFIPEIPHLIGNIIDSLESLEEYSHTV